MTSRVWILFDNTEPDDYPVVGVYASKEDAEAARSQAAQASGWDEKSWWIEVHDVQGQP